MIEPVFFFYVLQATLNLSVYMFFVLKTFEQKLRYSMKTSLGVAILYTIFFVTMIELFLERTAPFGEHRLAASVLCLVVSVIFCVCTLTVHPAQILFFILAVFDIEINVIMIARAVEGLGVLPPVFGSDVITYLLLTLLVLFLITPLIWHLFVNLFKNVLALDLSHVAWRPLFLLPLSYFLFAVFSIQNYEPAAQTSSWYNIIVLLTLNVATYLSYIYVLRMLTTTHNNLLALEKIKLTEQMLEMQKGQYEDMAAHIERTARMRHDLRHHMVAISEFARQEDLVGLKMYLQEYQITSPPDNEEPICANHFVDVILRHYIVTAKANGIRVETDVEISANFGVPYTELCVVFGNLVENAVESCLHQQAVDSAAQPFLTIKARMMSKSMMAITVRNSYDGAITQKGEGFVSSKHGGAGMGTASIRAVAEKNGGSCQFSFDHHVFKAYVLLVV